ncbi:LOW QUALITY PROTEIN: hypothetical protein Syun_009362 [Stephania yunnanensis]|uniref:Uncharacterized protein n=1 Tax=Stephania yunnanensis TaxID=152371 RepID=A0AAP0KG08_9MAGN
MPIRDLHRPFSLSGALSSPSPSLCTECLPSYVLHPAAFTFPSVFSVYDEITVAYIYLATVRTHLDKIVVVCRVHPDITILCALGVKSDFVTNKAWNRYRKYRASADFKARFEKASHNRKNEKGGPSTCPSKHTGGTRSFWTYEDGLALDREEDDEVTPNDVFLYVHMKDHDGVTFIDNRSARFHAELIRRREEHTQATPNYRLMRSNSTMMQQESA